MDLRSVRFGNTRIEYLLRESERRKTVNIAVESSARVVVTMPAGGDPARIDRVVMQRAAWIVERQQLKRDVQPAVPEREFVSGESFLYLGRSFRLRVVEGADGNGVKLEAGRFVARVADRGPAACDAVRSALVGWYRAHASQRFAERVEHWAPRVGHGRPKLIVSASLKRWGSCGNAESVRLNWRLVQAPMRLVDYVVVHELVHLRFDGHREDFWRACRRVLHDADERRDHLRQLEPRMLW